MYTASLRKSIDMLNKTPQVQKKARPSQKHQLAILFMDATKRVTSGGGQGPSCCIFQKAQSHG